MSLFVKLRIATVVGLATSVLVGLGTYFYLGVRRSRVKLKYVVPGVWQHPDATKGTWNRAIGITTTTELGRYAYCVFEETDRSLTESGTDLDRAGANELIETYLKKGYARLGNESYESYGV